MEYIQLNAEDENPQQIQNLTNIVWDEHHLCAVENLTFEEMALFRVHQVLDVDAPEVNPDEVAERDGYEFVDSAWKQKWKVRPATVDEVYIKKMLALAKINNDDNKIYSDVLGNKTTEYLDAANDAKAFKTAGYPDEQVPQSVKSWADAKFWTPTQAADDIIAQEAAWKGASNLIRQHRLKAKEDVKRSLTIADNMAAMAVWNAFVLQMRTQLGLS